MYCYCKLQKLQEEFLGSFGWTSDTYDLFKAALNTINQS